MKTTAHAIISSATGLGLASFTIISFIIAGIAAPATVLSFSLLAVYGMCEIAVIDYTPLNLARGRQALFAETSNEAAANPNGAPTAIRFEKAATNDRAAA
jgi:hypothetical protein